ncbi:MAG TPA: GNAT family N-acetyltransferase [Rhodospirillaceae bacterium]|nr:MAG: hypothetical protein A2018_03335 [Alphaproteobacteria bacterium GWF2_58_20]HAU29320.1 GNAT family N-acetyltransferase [Rhodospirillaceae bacterium]
MGGIDNPILLDLPVPIRTKRLTLRPMQAGDGQAMNEAIAESASELARFPPWATPLPTISQSEERARQFSADFILRKLLAFCIMREGRMIGLCGLHKIDWKIPSAEIGYWLRTSTTGHGYMTEAVNALSLYAFRVPGLRRLVLGCDDDNAKSAGVAERPGFALESKAFGKHLKRDTDELATSRIYVRFNADGLDDTGVSWGA